MMADRHLELSFTKDTLSGRAASCFPKLRITGRYERAIQMETFLRVV